jgi:polyhydroxybutyrate depolymerase
MVPRQLAWALSAIVAVCGCVEGDVPWVGDQPNPSTGTGGRDSGAPSGSDGEGNGDGDGNGGPGGGSVGQGDAGVPAADASSEPGSEEPGSDVDAGDDPAEPTPEDAGSQEPEPGPGTQDPSSPGCSASRPLAAGDSTRTITVGGLRREYLLHVPRSYDGSKPVPLVLDFHPLGGSASSQSRSSGFKALSDREGFIVAFPNGVNPAWNVGPCCTKSRDVDDVAFARAVVEEIKRDACIDVKRVYSVGFSNGGGMTHHLACNAADVFAAVAPAAFDLLIESEQPCAPSRPISVKMYRSTNDSVVPYGGGASTPPTLILGYSLNTIHFEGAENTFKRWARLNRCTGTPSASAGGCQTYTTCADGVEVTLCTSRNGHAGPPAEDAWATLKRFTLP